MTFYMTQKTFWSCICSLLLFHDFNDTCYSCASLVYFISKTHHYILFCVDTLNRIKFCMFRMLWFSIRPQEMLCIVKTLWMNYIFYYNRCFIIIIIIIQCIDVWYLPSSCVQINYYFCCRRIAVHKTKHWQIKFHHSIVYY